MNRLETLNAFTDTAVNHFKNNELEEANLLILKHPRELYLFFQNIVKESAEEKKEDGRYLLAHTWSYVDNSLKHQWLVVKALERLIPECRHLKNLIRSKQASATNIPKHLIHRMLYELEKKEHPYLLYLFTAKATPPLFQAIVKEAHTVLASGCSLLHLGVERCDVKLVQTVLKKASTPPCDSNYSILMAADCRGKTPLHIALELNHEGLVETLLNENRRREGFLLASRDNRGRSFLHGVVERGQREMAQLLVRNAHIKELIVMLGRDYGGETPLILAVKRGDIKIARLLLQEVDSKKLRYILWTPDHHKRTALHWADSLGNKQLLDLLLDKLTAKEEEILCSFKQTEAMIERWRLDKMIDAL